MQDANYWINKLQLESHPEGGWFREVYRSKEKFTADKLPDRYQDERNVSTSIYYLLGGDNRSVFHRLKSDETWHFYTGTTSVLLYIISPNGTLKKHSLGPDAEKNEIFQTTIPRNHWFAALLNNRNGYSLVGCTVAPGFDYRDFEIGERTELIQLFPQHSQLIKKLSNE